MITVIKKKGHKQDFDVQKIKRSIMKVAEEAGAYVSDKDADLMSSDVERNIIKMRGEDGLTSAFEIRALVIEEMKNYGFKHLVEVYERGKPA